MQMPILWIRTVQSLKNVVWLPDLSQLITQQDQMPWIKAKCNVIVAINIMIKLNINIISMPHPYLQTNITPIHRSTGRTYILMIWFNWLSFQLRSSFYSTYGSLPVKLNLITINLRREFQIICIHAVRFCVWIVVWVQDPMLQMP